MFIEKITNYIPKNEQEIADKRTILKYIKNNPDVLHRSNEIAHMTSSAIVINESMTKILFAFHNIFQSWSWVGGHNDGDNDCLAVAIREAKEETGVKNIRPYNEDIFMIDTLYVPCHYKKGVFISDHLHLNITYLLIADENDSLFVKKDENSGVKWFEIDDVLNHVSEPRMHLVYQKAIDRIKTIRNKKNTLSGIISEDISL